MTPIFNVGDKVKLKDTEYIGTIVSYENVASHTTPNNLPEELLEGEVFVRFIMSTHPIFDMVTGRNDIVPEVEYLWRGPEWMLERINDEESN